MPSVTIEEAQARLPELLDSLQSGEELTILHGGEPVCDTPWYEKESRE